MSNTDRAGAKFVYSIKTETGYNSKTEGRLRGPTHHGVVLAALGGQFVDAVDLLTAAPDLLAVLKDMTLTHIPRDCHERALAAIAKAEGRSDA